MNLTNARIFSIASTLALTMFVAPRDARAADPKDAPTEAASATSPRAPQTPPPPIPPPPAQQEDVAPPPPTPPVEPPPEENPAPEPRHHFSKHRVAMMSAGAAMLGLGFGIGFGVAALNDKSDFDKNPTASVGREGNEFAVASDVCFGIAVAGGITSVILFFSDDDAPQTPAAPGAPSAPDAPNASSSSSSSKHVKNSASITVTPTPILLPHGGGAGALFRF